ncbi:MAG: cobalt-precorrin-6A reductase [Hyphomicrobiaceae bacterium]|nr:cobalt-precorrin-6A reductase [Hyphomicrobiaceae bacterium]
MPREPRKILILGGTGQARHLAEKLVLNEDLFITTSLAGVTQDPQSVRGRVRSGGFGGAEGLRAYLEDEHIELLIDAVHPFAAQMSANAVEAASAAEVRCLRLERPPWPKQPGDRWREVDDVAGAAQAIAGNARALVTVGRQEIAPFFAREDIAVVARMIEAPGIPVPDRAEVILARPPFTLQQETELMEDRRIDVLVTKNSGGDDTVAKISAARKLGLPVIIVKRPEKPDTVTARSVDEMIALIDGRSA